MKQKKDKPIHYVPWSWSIRNQKTFCGLRHRFKKNKYRYTYDAYVATCKSCKKAIDKVMTKHKGWLLK